MHENSGRAAVIELMDSLHDLVQHVLRDVLPFRTVQFVPSFSAPITDQRGVKLHEVGPRHGVAVLESEKQSRRDFVLAATEFHVRTVGVEMFASIIPHKIEFPFLRCRGE